MPTVLALLAASVASWLLDAAIAPWCGTAIRVVASLIVGTFGYTAARRFFAELRG